MGDHSPKTFVQVQALSFGLYDVYVLLVCKTNAGLGLSWMLSLAIPLVNLLTHYSICHDEAGYIDTDMCHTQLITSILYAKVVTMAMTEILFEMMILRD